MNIILLNGRELTTHREITLTDYRAKHIIEILRAQPGQELKVGIINGPKGVATVEQIDDESVELSCAFETAIPKAPSIDILLALPRPKVMRRIWSQLATLGVGQIYVTNAEKVERNYFDTHILQERFYKKEILDGLMQAGDTHVPKVEIQKRLKPFLEDVISERYAKQPKYLAYEGEAPRLNQLDLNPGTHRLVAIGPEGGWTPYEVDLFEAQGFETVSLGDRILKTEMACIAAVCMLG